VRVLPRADGAAPGAEVGAEGFLCRVDDAEIGPYV
jgi:hypothetical protein